MNTKSNFNKAVLIAGLLLAAPFSRAGKAEWLTDFEAARKLAGEKNRPVLVDFSGSDWCGWCIKLDREVFSQESFGNYAKQNLVLFLADFPRGKAQPAEVARKNAELAKKYGVRGFPTVLLVNADGKIIARTGYRDGGPGAYVSHLRELIEGAGNAN